MKQQPRRAFADFLPSIRQRPWPYFLLFTATNALLSYGSLNLPLQIGFGLLGIALPFFLGLPRKGGALPKNGSPFRDSRSSVPLWAWVAVLAFSALPRLIPLLSPAWITPDDGLVNFFPIQLSKEWKWQFFFTTSQFPPLYYWLLSLYFKLVQPSLFSTRLVQFVLALLSVALFGTACRKFFSSSFSFIALVFFSVGFWPLFCSRFLLPQTFVLVWEVLTFAALGSFWKARSARGEGASAFALGLVAGLGFWAVIQWILVPLAVLPLVLFKPLNKDSGSRWMRVTLFGAPLMLLALPFFFVFFQQNMGGHMQILMAHETHTFTLQRVKDLLSNGFCLFWLGHAMAVNEGYTPIWGGMLNPLEGALCFLGLSVLGEGPLFPLARWLAAASLLFLLPGLVTNAYQIFHILLILPLLYLLVALGAQTLLVPVPRRKRPWFLGAVLLFSIPLSLTQLMKTYDFSPTPESRVFEILNRLQSQEGPGFLFLDLRTDTEDHSLNLAAYPLNAAENPRLQADQAKWAAVICNAHYQPFLKKRFPDGQWYWIGPDGFWNQGGLMLAVLPVREERRDLFRDWLEADRQLHAIDVEYYSSPWPFMTTGLFQRFLAQEERIRKDAFLESVFWEKAIFWKKNSLPAPQLLPWIQKALEKGYPAAHLLVTEGLLLDSMGRSAEARAAFQKATRAPLDLTTASKILKAMGAPKKP